MLKRHQLKQRGHVAIPAACIVRRLQRREGFCVSVKIAPVYSLTNPLMVTAYPVCIGISGLLIQMNDATPTAVGRPGLATAEEGVIVGFGH